MAIMDLLYIHGFCAPLSISYELSPLQSSSVSVQNHNVEIYREYLLCRYRVTLLKIKIKQTESIRDANNSGTMPMPVVINHFECSFMEVW